MEIRIDIDAVQFNVDIPPVVIINCPQWRRGYGEALTTAGTETQQQGGNMKKILPWVVGILAGISVAYAADDVPRAISTLKSIAVQEVRESNDRFPEWLKRFDVSVEGVENSKPTWSIETVQPLYQTPDTLSHTAFFQGRWGHRSGADTLNLGAGYRRLLDDRSWLLGVNAFYDMELDVNHRRFGLGGEAIGRYATFRANYYKPDSGTKTVSISDGITKTEKALRGHDFGIDLPVPYLPWMRLSATSFRWNAATSGVADQKGEKYTLFGNVTDQISFEIGKTDDNSLARNDSFFKLTYTLALGKTLNGVEGSLLGGARSRSAFTERDLTQHTLNKVVRQNDIIAEKTSSGGGGVSIGRRN